MDVGETAQYTLKKGYSGVHQNLLSPVWFFSGSLGWLTCSMAPLMVLRSTISQRWVVYWFPYDYKPMNHFLECTAIIKNDSLIYLKHRSTFKK